MLIACNVHWEMGHRIPEHPGLCRNVHGHSYRMRVGVEGSVQPSGMVMDFFDLRGIIQPIVDDLDHSFLCDEHDAVMRDFFAAHPMKVVVVPFATTVENISQHVLEMVCGRLKAFGFIQAVTVRIEETASSFAEARAVVSPDAP